MQITEFWPEYGAGPVWTEDGKPVDLVSLGVDQDLTERVQAWNSLFTEDKVPVDGPGDLLWLQEGRVLLGEMRAQLGASYRVVVTEVWWGEEPWWSTNTLRSELA